MTTTPVDLDALLCALVLAPATFSRNRFYDLFDGAGGKRVRRKAKRLRGLVRQLLGQGREQAEMLGQIELEDGSLMLRFRVKNLDYQRTTALSALEASILNYALHRAGQGELRQEDRARVEAALLRLGHAELPEPPEPPAFT